MHKRGFTLVELLIVIAIIAIIAAVVFVALNPLKRFQDARDAARWEDVAAISEAIKIHQLDNNGQYIDAFSPLISKKWYMIVDGDLDQGAGTAMSTGCDDNNEVVGVDCEIGDDKYCVDLDELVNSGYLGDVPVAPDSGTVTWDDGDTVNDQGTGYALYYNATASTVTIMACEAEGTTSISITR